MGRDSPSMATKELNDTPLQAGVNQSSSYASTYRKTCEPRFQAGVGVKEAFKIIKSKFGASSAYLAPHATRDLLEIRPKIALRYFQEEMDVRIIFFFSRILIRRRRIVRVRPVLVCSLRAFCGGMCMCDS